VQSVFRRSASGDTLCWIESGKPDPAKIFGEKPKGPTPLSAYLQTAVITGLADAKLFMHLNSGHTSINKCFHFVILLHFVGLKVGLRIKREFAVRSSNVSSRPFISGGVTKAKNTEGSST